MRPREDHGDRDATDRRRRARRTLRRRLQRGLREDYKFAVIIVLVRTDEGLTGIGEASLAGPGPRRCSAILDHFARAARRPGPGQDRALVERADARHVLVERPGDHERGRRDRHRALGSEGQGARRAGLELLGGPTRDRVRVYVHLAGDGRGADRGRARAEGGGVHGAALRHARRVRVHRSGTRRRRSWRRSRAPRRCATALGDEVDLLLDAHTMFSPAEAAYLGHALEPYRLFFYEDPIRPLNPTSLRLVRDKVNLPIATGEQLAHKWEFQPLIESELRRLPPHRHGPRGRDHRGEEDPRDGRGARPALGAAPRELAGQRASPACTSTWRCRTSASRSGPSSSRCTSSSRTRLAPRPDTSSPPDGPGPRPGVRRGGGAQAALARRAAAAALLARRQRRRLLRLPAVRSCIRRIRTTSTGDANRYARA